MGKLLSVSRNDTALECRRCGKPSVSPVCRACLKGEDVPAHKSWAGSPPIKPYQPETEGRGYEPHFRIEGAY